MRACRINQYAIYALPVLLNTDSQQQNIEITYRYTFIIFQPLPETMLPDVVSAARSGRNDNFCSRAFLSRVFRRFLLWVPRLFVYVIQPNFFVFSSLLLFSSPPASSTASHYFIQAIDIVVIHHYIIPLALITSGC